MKSRTNVIKILKGCLDMEDTKNLMNEILQELKKINSKIEKWEEYYEKKKLLDEGVKNVQALFNNLR